MEKEKRKSGSGRGKSPFRAISLSDWAMEAVGVGMDIMVATYLKRSMMMGSRWSFHRL